MAETATTNEMPSGSEALRVAMLSKSLTRSGGGLTPVMQSLARSLVSDFGVQLEAYGIDDEHVKEDLHQWAPIKAQAFSSVGPKSLSFSPGMAKAVLDFDSDVVHTHGLWAYPSLAAMKFTQRTGRPHVVSLHGMLNPVALSHSRWKKQLIGGWMYENKHLRTAACIHALSQAEAAYARDYGVKAPICVAPNGVELPAAQVDLPAPWAKEIPDDARVLLSLGRFNPIKGLPNLLRGWKHAKSLSGDEQWRLALVGWGQYGHEEELKQLTAELGLSQSVHFLGPQFGDAKSACYTHADAFVLPSLSEAFPMVVLEAWANRLPVLMTPTCNIPEGFEHDAALRMETNAGSIGERLGDLFAMSPDDIDAMGNRGYQLVADRFSWHRVGGAMREVYDWVADRGPQPNCVTTI